MLHAAGWRRIVCLRMPAGLERPESRLGRGSLVRQYMKVVFLVCVAHGRLGLHVFPAPLEPGVMHG